MADTLYQISDRLRAVIEQGLKVDEGTGEYWDERDINALQASMADKVGAVSMYAAGRRTLAKARRDAAKAMSESAMALEAEADRMDEYAMRCLRTVGGKVETDAVTVSIRKCPPSVEVVDADDVPEEFMTVKVTKSPNKTAIKKAMMGGESVPGCALVVNEKIQVR